MTRARIALAAAILCAVVAAPARAEFADVVRAVEARAGGHKTPIPLFGLVRMVVWMIHPDGVHDIQMATWEDTVTIPPEEIIPLLRSRAGAGYQPIITQRSKRSGEWTYICARPASHGLLDLMLVTHDRQDTVVMRAVVEPKVLSGELARGEDHHTVKFARR